MSCRERVLIASGRPVKTSNVKFSMDNKELHHQHLGNTLSNIIFEGKLNNILTYEKVLPLVFFGLAQNIKITVHG